MILEVYSVFDSKTGIYSQPMFQASRGGAVRAFGDAVSNPESVFHKHRGDYSLFFVGRFDDNVGVFVEVPDKPDRVIGADELGV